ncbi:MAG: carbon-nitrogen hydrolase family protein [SAR202 cluster bacterium]|nr:carbon-nitrogen hydrolase family protein [SAR202 cluster bacterium]
MPQPDGNGTINLATCQFPVSDDIARNSRYVQDQIARARKSGAKVVHFSECALSGYAGVEYDSADKIDWALLEQEMPKVCKAAKKHKVWVALGSSHRLSPGNKPHNSVYVITPEGEIYDRYDKRFCTAGDLNHYTSGDHFVCFEVNGVKLGVLICYDVRFPELYREYKKIGVQVVLHSFYNARAEKKNIHTTIMRPTLQSHAGINAMYISAPNACGFYQSWPSVFITPDGVIAKSLRQHQAGVMMNKIDLAQKFYDASEPFRDKAMNHILNSGDLVDDARSRDRESA